MLTGNGTDYDSTPINATFRPGTANSTIKIPIIPDDILEQLETFELTFTIPTTISDVIIEGRQTSAIGIINDTTS